MTSTHEIMIKAKQASSFVGITNTNTRNDALYKMADALEREKESILIANQIDIKMAEGKINSVMIDRLKLTDERILSMAKGLREVALLPDPLSRPSLEKVRENGLTIKKVPVPIGVVAIIYESRPNVTSDAASLAIKSGNACILRTGKEAYNSAKAIVDALKKGLEKSGISPDAVQLISDTTHDSANELMRGNGYVDLLIPRGSERLIKACIENATVPCIQTGTGICHIYVDESADIEMALNIIENAKTSRPSVCNAAEVCIVNNKIAKTFLPKLKDRLNNVELRGDSKVQEIIDCTPAGANDFDTEFLDYILAVKVVDDVIAATNHIKEHSTGHSEAIISTNFEAIDYFTKVVDSAAVYVNASTRFTDGGEFGLGCEMGISTQKLHARGPMGLEELTTYKYVILGNGQTR